MYAQERNPKHSFMSIGVQAYREEGILNFLTGTYYVKITTVRLMSTTKFVPLQYC